MMLIAAFNIGTAFGMSRVDLESESTFQNTGEYRVNVPKIQGTGKHFSRHLMRQQAYLLKIMTDSLTAMHVYKSSTEVAMLSYQ